MNGSKKLKSKTITLFYLAINPQNMQELEEKSEKEHYGEYDERGNETLVESYIANMGLDTKVVNKYNGEGKLVQKEEWLQGDEFSEKRTYSYANGELTEERKYYIDETFDTILYKYNSDGNLIEKTITDSDGEEEGKTVFEYENDRLITRTTYEEGDLESKEVRQYDSNGNVIEASLYNADDEIDTQIISEYNGEGKVIRSTFEDDTSTNYTYNDQGLLAKEVTIDERGEEIKTTQYTYNENGDVLKREDVLKNIAGISEQHYRREFEYTYW